MAGKLSVVATPIGNLEDITLRALRILKEANAVACEDTRVTKKLLSHFDIHTPVIGYARIQSLLEDDKHVALVSDAGTPGVSDPGQEIVAKARDAGAQIEVVPGASALAAALSISGIRASSCVFYGFLPVKKGRETLFKEIAGNERASVFYESPHRIVKCLNSLAAAFAEASADQRRIGLYRELTKIYEEAIIGTPREVLEQLVEEKRRGEFVVICEAQ